MSNAPEEKRLPLEPILVKNPLSGRYVNVAPMFDIMNDMFDDHFSDMAKHLTKAIEMSAVYVDKDFRGTDEFSWNLYVLFNIRDMLDRMDEYKAEK